MGDTIGLIGNTGNAMNTPLTFILEFIRPVGPVDPLPFIHPAIRKPHKITGSLETLHQFMRTADESTLHQGPDARSDILQKFNKSTQLFILAATADWYKIELMNGLTGFMKVSSVTAKGLGPVVLNQPKNLRLHSYLGAQVRRFIPLNEEIQVQG